MLLGRRTVYREHDRGAVAPSRCPGCHRDVAVHLVESEIAQQVFYGDVTSRTDGDSLVCSRCRHQVVLEPELSTRARTMVADTQRFLGGVMRKDAYLQNVADFWAAVVACNPRAGFRGGMRDEAQPDGWRPDPSGRHQYRFWDGRSWCAYVRDGDETSTDGFMAPMSPGWYPDPDLEADLRYWDGRVWTRDSKNDEPASK